MSPQIAHYLMRTIDGALILGKDLVVAMMKLGPIMTLTSIQPTEIEGYPNSMIGRTGRIDIEQMWSNGKLNTYLFVVQPNEMDKLRIKTERQKAQVDQAFEKNKGRIDKTMSVHVIKSDIEKKA